MIKQHGGARYHPPGREGGRPKKDYPMQNIKIACTPDELQQILSTIKDTRLRATILLNHKGESKMSKELSTTNYVVNVQSDRSNEFGGFSVPVYSFRASETDTEGTEFQFFVLSDKEAEIEQQLNAMPCVMFWQKI